MKGVSDASKSRQARRHTVSKTRDAATRAPPTKKQKFWSQRPFTRVVSWGRDFDSTLSYLKLNTLESFGFISRKFTRALPSQAIRQRILSGLSLALSGIDLNRSSQAPQLA